MSEGVDNKGESAGKIATVGSFDGVHAGHRKVIGSLKDFGRERGLEPLVITFDRHPLSVVAPERTPRLLDAPEKRDERLRTLGVEVRQIAFTAELSRLTASEWMERLRDEYGVKAVLTGYDNKFGRDGRSLRHDDYVAIGSDLGLEVLEAPEVPGISSSRIRNLIAAGEVEEAEDMLLRPYSVSGTVVDGRHLGRTLGFPTANIDILSTIQLPAAGVYAALADGRPAVVNIGNNPTVADNNPVTVEVHLINFEGDLYGKEMEVEFLKRIRREEKFDNLEELRAGISRDISEAAEIISNYK